MLVSNGTTQHAACLVPRPLTRAQAGQRINTLERVSAGCRKDGTRSRAADASLMESGALTATGSD